jgi:hypothetical protein
MDHLQFFAATNAALVVGFVFAQLFTKAGGEFEKTLEKVWAVE